MSTHKHCFVAFVDESGDEGFKMETGSSEWFVLSAVIVRAEIELQTVKLVDDVRTQIGTAPGKALHFRKLEHERRLPVIERISKAPVRIMSVLAHKPTLKGSTLVTRPRLYFYCTRLLLERISWFCRYAPTAPGMSGCSAKVVFSYRGGTPYSELIDYVKRLQSGAEDGSVRIHWPAIDVEAICSLGHEKSMGLQIADAAAGAFFAAVTKSKYGYTEDRYARMLRPVVYHRGGNYLSYGLKFMPDLSRLPEVAGPFDWLIDGYK